MKDDLPEGWDSSKVADVVEDTANNRKAPIPVGYTASQISTEDEISEGLVIYQTATAVTGEPNSEAHITAMEGINQYVWIPVDDINDMVMCKYNNKTTKIDGTAKGGVVIGICDELKIPVKFIGVGEKIDDFERFNSEDFVKAILE